MVLYWYWRKHFARSSIWSYRN